MNRLLDILLPRFITEEVALTDAGDHLEIACSMADVKPGERFAAVATVRTLNLFGMGLFPTLIGEPREWPAKYQDPRNGTEIWSANGEDWHNYLSLDELIQETDCDLVKISAGDEVFIGTKAYPDPASFVDIHDVLTCMYENAINSDHAEWVDRWPSPSDEAKQELSDLLESWARKHCSTDFYLIDSVRTYAVTEADIERTRQQPGSPEGLNQPQQGGDQ
ncbi:hypothetical protein [Ectopseudomonas mendocina]|uniref:hypothetical protein n=1 Tax=Ectopseudomonas mendocina TaxID=300 RepID=UPI00376F343D